MSRIAGWLLGLAVVQYWILEALTAAAWHKPGYRYDVNYISDLGVTVPGVFDGRVVDSPLHVLMGASFVAIGILVAVAGILLFRQLAGRRIRWAVLVIGIAYCLGSSLVALFPENTILAVHLAGASFNILGGNVLAILIGTAGGRLGFRRPLSGVIIALGAIGLVDTALFLSIPFFATGAGERASIYTYLVAFLIAGIALAVRRSEARAQPASSH